MKTFLALVILVATSSQSANFGDNPFDLGRMQDIAARPMALGGSYTAVASDASALYYNAAGLSAVKKHEWSATLERDALYGMDRADGYADSHPHQEDLRIQSLAYLLPIPTSRGGLTFAFGYYRPRTFSDLLTYTDSLAPSRGPYRYEAEGTLDQYRVGMGLDLSPDVSLGLAVSYLSGEESILVENGGQEAYLRSYSGLNLEPSLMFKLTPRMRLGLSLVVSERINDLKEVYEVKGQDNQQTDYSVKHPFQAKAGWAYQGDSYLLAADMRLNAWSQYKYGLQGGSDPTKAGYKDEMAVSVGGEKFIRPLNLVLRAGYAWNTLPGTDFDPTYGLHRFSTGVGLLLSGSFSVDAAYSYAFWGMAGQGLNLENKEQRGLVTFAYRY